MEQELLVELELEQARFLYRWVTLLGALLVVVCLGNASLQVVMEGTWIIGHYVLGAAAGALVMLLARLERAEWGLVLALFSGASVIAIVHFSEAPGNTAPFYLLPVTLMGALILQLRTSALLSVLLVAVVGVARTFRPFPDEFAVSHTIDMLLVVGCGTLVAMVVRNRHIQENKRLRQALVDLKVARVEQTRLREQAEVSAQLALAANEAKSRFLANMSHELRTPLNAIIGYSELMEEEVEPGQAPDLQRIGTAGQHLLGIIDDVLDLARVESGGREVHCEKLRLAEVLDELRSWVAVQVQVRGNQLVTEVDPELEWVSDRLMLRQILLNLLANANRFTEHGRIRVGTRLVDGFLQIDVEDTGIGIAADQLDAIFEPFHQGGADIGARDGGTGLGLSLVQRFVDRLGGQVSVRSTVGEGSCFTVSLAPCESGEN